MISSYFSDNFYKRFIIDELDTNFHCMGGTILVKTMAENAVYEGIDTGYSVITFLCSRYENFVRYLT